MIHSHEEIGDLFKVETTSTIDYKCDWVKDLPDKDKFPEYHTKFFNFFNRDPYMTEGEYTFGDVESGALMKVKFKTMPVRI